MSMDAKSATSSATSPLAGGHRGAGDTDLHVAQGDLLVSDGHRACDPRIWHGGFIHDRTHDPTKSLKTAVAPQHLSPGNAGARMTNARHV